MRLRGTLEVGIAGLLSNWTRARYWRCFVGTLTRSRRRCLRHRRSACRRWCRPSTVNSCTLLRCSLFRPLIIGGGVVETFKLPLQLKLSLASGLDLRTTFSKLGFFFLSFFLGSLLASFLFLLFHFALPNLLLKSLQTIFGSSALLVNVVFSGLSFTSVILLASKRKCM